MTKAELIERLTDIPDTAQVLVECVASGTYQDFKTMLLQAEVDFAATGRAAELSELNNVHIIEKDGDSEAFAIIAHQMTYIR